MGTDRLEPVEAALQLSGALARVLQREADPSEPFRLLRGWPRPLALFTVRTRAWEIIATHTALEEPLPQVAVDWLDRSYGALPRLPLSGDFARERDRAAAWALGRADGGPGVVPPPPPAVAVHALSAWAELYSCHAAQEERHLSGRCALAGRDVDVARAAVLAASQHRLLATARLLAWLPCIRSGVRRVLTRDLLQPLRARPRVAPDVEFHLALADRRLPVEERDHE